jgi:hypothetical protein
LTKKAKEQVQARAAEAAARLTEEASQATSSRSRVVAELAAAEVQSQAVAGEVAKLESAALSDRDALSQELEAERHGLLRGVAEAEAELRERDANLRESLNHLSALREEVAAAPRPAPEDHETSEVRSEVACLRSLVAEQQEESSKHQAAARAEETLEEQLRSELAELTEAATVSRAQRLCTLAYTRAELICERRAAEDAVQEELAAALAEEEAKQRRATEEQRRLSESSTAPPPGESSGVPDTTSSKRGSTGVFKGFLDKLSGFAEVLDGPIEFDADASAGATDFGKDIEALSLGLLQGSQSDPAQEDAPVVAYLPKKLQNGIIVLVPGERSGTMQATNEYLGADTPGLAYRGSKDLGDRLYELLPWGTAVDCIDEGNWVRCTILKDMEAQAIRQELAGWERRTVACERQLEWMQRDFDRRKKEVETITSEVSRLQVEASRSRTAAEELEQELTEEKQKLLRHQQRLRAHLARTVISCRERILGALRHGTAQTESELESLFDDGCDWAAPMSPSGTINNTSQQAPLGTVLKMDAEGETFVSGLEALCDDLERYAVNAAEDARSFGNLGDAMVAFNAASDAMELADNFPDTASPQSSRKSSADSPKHFVFNPLYGGSAREATETSSDLKPEETAISNHSPDAEVKFFGEDQEARDRQEGMDEWPQATDEAHQIRAS